MRNMTEQKNGEAPGWGSWQLELVRVTLLLKSGEIRTVRWADLTGEPAETREERTKVKQIVEAGLIDDHIFRLSQGPGRIDCVLTAGPDEMATGRLSMGAVEAVLTTFLPIVLKWLDGLDLIVSRIAFGVILLKPVDTKEMGHTELARYLPFLKLPIDSKDFFLQINRPLSATAAEEPLTNRLSKWSVAAVHQLLIRPNVDGTAKQNNASTQYFVRLELDINTDAAWVSALSDLDSRLSHLVDCAANIATNGVQS